MEKYIRYKRFSEVHTEKTLQDFLDRLITEGWEIIYYEEVKKSSGTLTDTPGEISIHITVLAGKKQETDLKKVL
jgi:hypothetical protein